MGKYFLIKERNYCKIDGQFRGRDVKLMPGSWDDYNEAIKEAGAVEQTSDDIVFVVEIVAKCHGFAKVVQAAREATEQPLNVCIECGWPEHEGRCGPESLPKH